MSNLKNMRDLDATALPARILRQIDAFVARGCKRGHLVISEASNIHFDRELAGN